MIVLFLLRGPRPGPHQHALPDMIFWLTSASDLNHVLSTLQTSYDLSIGVTASQCFEPRKTAECIDRCKAVLSCCVPAPSFRRCDRPQLDRQGEACFRLLSRALRYLASSLPDKQPLTNSAANMLQGYQLRSFGNGDAICDPLVPYSPAPSDPSEPVERII